MSIPREDMLAIEVPQQSTSAAKTTKTVNFKFNRVFGTAATQLDIFQEVKEVVQVNRMFGFFLRISKRLCIG